MEIDSQIKLVWK